MYTFNEDFSFNDATPQDILKHVNEAEDRTVNRNILGHVIMISTDIISTIPNVIDTTIDDIIRNISEEFSDFQELKNLAFGLSVTDEKADDSDIFNYLLTEIMEHTTSGHFLGIKETFCI